ncbi:MAG: hypothetical protein AB7F28_00685 [Candidatus Margulisiibacteriota bacterium]
MSAEEQLGKDHLERIAQVANQLQSLIYELETEALHNTDLRKHHYDMAIDTVPLIRKLSEAKKHALFTLSHFQKPRRSKAS